MGGGSVGAVGASPAVTGYDPPPNPPPQGGRAFGWGLLALVLLGLAFPAGAKEVYKPASTLQDEPVSLDELLPEFEDLLPPLAPPDVPRQKVVEEEEPEEAAVIKPSRKKAPEAEAAKPEALYKVYPAPYIAPEAPPVQPTRAHDETPPAATEPEPAPALPSPAFMAAMTKATAVGSQFFPILPWGASPDTVPQLLPMASNHGLDEDHSAITRAIVFIHDLSREAGAGVATLTTLAGGDNDTTLILAPQFPLSVDITRFGSRLPEGGRNVARWMGDGGLRDAWSSGGLSVSKPPQQGVSSFAAIDLLLLYLADTNRFPRLQSIVLVGHGMGGDFVQRYAAAGIAPDLIKPQGLPVRYLVANASSYIYFTGARPSAEGPSFARPDMAQCPGVNRYPYGLDDLTAYARRNGGNAMRLRYTERRVMYLLSDRIASDPYLDTSCAAAVQGRSRVERGRNYERYLVQSFGDSALSSQSFTLVPNSDYDPAILFGSYCGLAMLFGDGACASTLMPH